jgi:hypothetical protein
MAPREGELTYYDRAGWAWSAFFRITDQWFILTLEDGEQMIVDRAELFAALFGFHPADVIRQTDGQTDTQAAG